MSADLTKPTARPVAAPFTEHRSHPRYPFTASVEVSETESGTTNKARVSDIGLGGCYVDTNSPFSSGTSVKVRIIREKKSFQALGKVVYSLPGMGMGIQFITVEPEQLWILGKWVAEVAGARVRCVGAGRRTASHPRNPRIRRATRILFFTN